MEVNFMPSEKVLEAKKAQVSELIDVLKAAQTGVLVDYRGLTVEEDTDLRRKLRAANVKYFVVKNTLLRLAAKETGLDALDEILHGPTALAVSDTQLHRLRFLRITQRTTKSLSLNQALWTAVL